MNEGAGTGHDAAQDEKKIGNGGSGSTPQYDAEGHLINTNGHRVTKGIQPDGESGRRGFHPLWFLRVCWASSCTASKWTNVLWPFTVAAMVLHFGFHNLHVWIFVCSYVGMVPAANLVGFAGQELARKMPKVAGVMLETTFGSLVEIILFVALLVQGGNENTPVIRAAILGSILANLLFSLGALVQRLQGLGFHH
jgi:Ca2+:H+ antiporter